MGYGLQNLEIKRAAISGATSGDNTLVTAVTGKKIRVLSLVAIADTDVKIRFEDGAGGTALTGRMDCGTAGDSGGFVLPFNPGGWFETSVATLLNMELTAAVQVSGCLTYQEV